MVNLLLEVFTKKNFKKAIQEEFRIEKSLKRKEKVINCISNGKDMIIHLILGVIKTTSYKNKSILS